jgi:small-conductance mechanosensitive channel/CRP-like cAMP-binding protein
LIARRRSSILLPLGASVALFALYYAFRSHPLFVGSFGDVREEIFGTNLRGLLVLAVVAAVFVLVRLIDVVIFDLVFSKRRQVTTPQLLREIVDILLYAILLAWAAAVIFQFSLTGFLATGSVLAVVLGFALQDTLGNLFAGISLHMDGSFVVGDVIRSGEHIGVVEGIRWRGTRIRTFANNIVTLPNALLARERLEIFPFGNLNARVLVIGVDSHVAPAAVIDVLQQAAANVEGVAQEIPCLVRVGGFGESSVQYEVKYWTRDYSRRDTIDADIRRAAWYALHRNAMPIPYPIRSVQPYRAPSRQDHELSRPEILTRLDEVDIFSPLSAEAHQALADSAHVRFYPHGETILRRGAPGDSMFVIHQGTVSIRVAEAEAKELKEVASLDAGSFFGEMSVLTGEARSAWAVAVTDVTLIEIAKDALEPILHDHPELADGISAKVMERRSGLDSFRASIRDDQHASMLERVRAYFGI